MIGNTKQISLLDCKYDRQMAYAIQNYLFHVYPESRMMGVEDFVLAS